MFFGKVFKGVAKVAIVSGATFFAGVEINDRYHTEDPSPLAKERASRMMADLAREGLSKDAYVNHVKVGKSVNAFHLEAGESTGFLDRLRGEDRSSVSIRHVSLFNDAVRLESARKGATTVLSANDHSVAFTLGKNVG